MTSRTHFLPALNHLELSGAWQALLMDNRSVRKLDITITCAVIYINVDLNHAVSGEILGPPLRRF